MITRLNTVFLGLILATLGAVMLNSQAAHDLLTASGAAVVAAIIAFAKARFVVSDFMDLRGTVQQRLFDIWLAVVGVGSIALLLR
jgi:undecaprenyl pyrophosphate phosphatase UppP